MRTAYARVLGTGIRRQVLKMDWRGWLAAAAVRRYVLPILIGVMVTWLAAHNHPDFADALCSVAAGLAIAVEACR